MFVATNQIAPTDQQNQQDQIQQLQQQIQLMQLQQQLQQQQLQQMPQQQQQQQFGQNNGDFMNIMVPDNFNASPAAAVNRIGINNNNLNQGKNKVSEDDVKTYVTGLKRYYGNKQHLIGGETLSKIADDLIQVSNLDIKNSFSLSKINFLCNSEQEMKNKFVQALSAKNHETDIQDIEKLQLVSAASQVFQSNKCQMYMYSILYTIVAIILYVIYTIKSDTLDEILINERLLRIKYEATIASGQVWWEDIPSEDGSQTYVDIIKNLSLLNAVVQSMVALSLIQCSIMFNLIGYKSSMWLQLLSFIILVINFGVGFAIPFFSEPNYFGLNMGSFMPLLTPLLMILIFQRIGYRKLKRLVVITGNKPTNFLH